MDETTRLRAVLEATTAFVGLADARGRLLEMNDAGRRLCGLADDEPLPDSLLALHPPWAAWRVASEGVAVASRDGLWSGETAVLGPGGVEVPVTEVLIGHYDDAGRLAALSVAMRDLTDTRQLEARVRQRARLLDAVREAIIAVDADGRVTEWNPAAERLYGRKAIDAARRPLGELLPADAEPLLAAVETARAEGSSWWGESTALDRDGRAWPVWAVVTPSVDDRDGRGGAILVATDISELRTAKQEAQRRADQHAALARLGQDALEPGELDEVLQRVCAGAVGAFDAELCGLFELTADGEGLWLRAGAGWDDGVVGAATVARSAATQPGYTLSVGAPVAVADVAAAERCAAPELWAAHGVRSSLTVPVTRQHGRVYGVLAVCHRAPRAFTDDDAAVLRSVAHIVGSAVDRDAAAAELRRLALYDPSTGLPNRTLLTDRLAHVLTRARNEGTRLAVLIVDVDVFDVVDVNLADSAREELLARVAARLSEAVQETDTVGRLGDDEFLVLCEDLPGDAAGAASRSVEVAERLVDAVAGHHELGDGGLHLAANVGIAHSRGDHDPEELKRGAHTALHRTRRRGRGDVELYEPQMLAEAVQYQELAHAVRHLHTDGQLFLVYQPQFDLRSGQLAGLEALLRWKHPERGVLSPAEFLDTAEETGLVVPIGSWVLHRACEHAASMATRARLPVAVNVSPHQLAAGDLPAVVDAALEASGLPPDRLQIELTEQVMIDGPEEALRTLTALRERGVSLAIDDFGTGYASLAYLKRFPVDVLKIDRSFVAGLDTRRDDQDLVTAVIGLARDFEVATVGEGVETELQRGALERLGCDRAQGFYWSRPLGGAELEQWLRRGAGRAQLAELS